MRPMLLALLVGCAPQAQDDPTAAPIEPYDPLELVDPMIGTGGPGASVGSINPGATRPWGLVVAGPSSRGLGGAPGFYHCAGYHYDDTHISGFTHTAAHGMGVTDYGGVLVMPKPGWDDRYVDAAERAAPFTHDREWASPGRYAVDLQDDGVHVELTATTHGAHHVYTFPEDATPTVLFDLGHTNGSDRVDAADLDVDLGTGRVTGFQRILGGYSERIGGIRHHFEAVFDPAPVAVGTWTDDSPPTPGRASVSGEHAGAWLTFPDGTTEVHLRLGLSFVDHDGAAANLAAELPDLDFDARLAEAEDAWRRELGNVRVRGGSESERRIFHTALYHAYQMPRIQRDVDGRYRGVDGEIHDDPGHEVYSDFSLWDTFRTQHPWLVLANPDRQRDMVRTLLLMARDGGALPRWPMAHGYTSGMIGTPALQVLAGSYLKGVRGWDAEAGFDVAWAQATAPAEHAGRKGTDSWAEKGYVSFEDSDQPASHTLEYAWSDHALALWADALGRDAEAEALWATADNWKNTFDPDQGFFFGRYDDGTFSTDEDPLAWSRSFVEGNAWQYLWMVPQDVHGLVDVQHDGDVDAFLDRYDAFWEASYREEDGALPELWYWHGNEPDIHYPYLGSLLGYPDHSARPARYVMQTKYADAGAGLDGNDDGGTLSAWYLFSAIGLYPVAGTPDYAVGSPIFERAEIDLPDGDTLVLRAPGTSPDALYVREASLGDAPLERSVITHQDLLDAGELVLEMGRDPVGWGR